MPLFWGPTLKAYAESRERVDAEAVREQLHIVEKRAQALHTAISQEMRLLLAPERHDRQSRWEEISIRCARLPYDLQKFTTLMDIPSWPKEFTHLHVSCQVFDGALSRRATRSALLTAANDLALTSKHITSTDFVGYYHSKIRLLEAQGKLKRAPRVSTPADNSFESEFGAGLR